jgi:hypothetical protein
VFLYLFDVLDNVLKLDGIAQGALALYISWFNEVRSDRDAYNRSTVSFKYISGMMVEIVPETLLNPSFTSFETITKFGDCFKFGK